MMNDDVMAAFGSLGIFTTRKVLGSLSEVPTKMIAEQENNFEKTVKNFIPPKGY